MAAAPNLGVQLETMEEAGLRWELALLKEP